MKRPVLGHRLTGGEVEDVIVQRVLGNLRLRVEVDQVEENRDNQ
jgi:hypothetical protein